MSRPVRIDVEGYWYHIVARGQRKDLLFLNHKDFGQYIKSLQKVLSKCDAALGAICLMPNHVHLLIKQGGIPLSRIFHIVHSRYAHYFNKKYNKTGHVFQGRYKSKIVLDEKYLVALLYYIHINPQRAGITVSPDKYRWSSDRFYRYGYTNLPIELTRVSGFEGSTGKNRYRSLLRRKPETILMPDNKIYIGNDADFARIERRKSGRDGKKYKERRGKPSLNSRLEELAKQYSIPVTTLIKTGKKWDIARVRQQIMIELYKENYPTTAIAKAFNRSPAMVYRALERHDN